ncbi:MAG: hypothetical protein R3255_01055 [Candidatus Lokiarchaeia archaeon]|nr:hypothetical protein [Candidatus Lokiarchaeia archaeon]
MVNDKFWEVIKKFNILMKSAIIGPDCLNVCNGDCCSIKINVPKVLANEYIKRGYASKRDFIRNDIFSFQLRFDEKKGKCFLYDKDLNGCLVHDSGIKPPQCWIYPTNFKNSKKNNISCKKVSGWRIIDPKKAEKAEKLLTYYVFLCQLEAKKEARVIINRINSISCRKELRSLLKKTFPSRLAGFRDTWECITILPAQGLSLQMKKFCRKYNNTCDLNYLDCESICEKVVEGLLDFLQENLLDFVKKKGPDHDGEYSFLNLFNVDKN